MTTLGAETARGSCGRRLPRRVLVLVLVFTTLSMVLVLLLGDHKGRQGLRAKNGSLSAMHRRGTTGRTRRQRERVAIAGWCTHDGFQSGASERGVSRCTVVERAVDRSPPGPGLVVVGCARFIAAGLRNRTMPYLDELLKVRSDTRIIVYHDSPFNDRSTREELIAWAAREPRVRLILSDHETREDRDRIARLTLCRNVLHTQALSTSIGLAQQGCVVQLDLDCESMPRLVALLAAAEALATVHAQSGRSPEPRGATSPRASFDVLTANSEGVYRDVWALRSTQLDMNYDCWQDVDALRARGDCAHRRIVVSPKAEPFAVEAAFNGMALFSAKALRTAASCRYENSTTAESATKTPTSTQLSLPPTSRQRVVACEHVAFQRCLRSHDLRIGLFPSLLLRCGEWFGASDARSTQYLQDGSVVHRPVSRAA
jgi:hypothetical protein